MGRYRPAFINVKKLNPRHLESGRLRPFFLDGSLCDLLGTAVDLLRGKEAKLDRNEAKDNRNADIEQSFAGLACSQEIQCLQAE